VFFLLLLWLYVTFIVIITRYHSYNVYFEGSIMVREKCWYLNTFLLFLSIIKVFDDCTSTEEIVWCCIILEIHKCKTNLKDSEHAILRDNIEEDCCVLLCDAMKGNHSLPWRKRQHFLPKRWRICGRIYGIYQAIVLWKYSRQYIFKNHDNGIFIECLRKTTRNHI